VDAPTIPALRPQTPALNKAGTAHIADPDPGLPARLRAIFVVAVVVALAAGAALLINLASLHATTQHLETLRGMEDTLQRLQASLLDAETAQRGYLLTGRPAYLEPYLAAKTVYPQTMANLAGMAIEEPALVKGLIDLTPLIEQKIAIIDRTIERFQTRGDIVPSDVGRQTMDRIREVIGGLRSQIDTQIAAAGRVSEQRTVATFAVATLAALLGVIALIVVYRAVVIEHERRNLAEEVLGDHSALLDAVAEGTEDWIFVKDRSGRLVFVNDAVSRAFGVPAGDLLGKLPGEYVADPIEAATIQENDLRIMARGVGERVEQVITTHGERRTYVSSKTPRIDASGLVIGLIGITTDITERKRAEDIMVEANERLSVAVAEKTAQLTELSRHLIRVSEEEKKQLAGELHDELGSLHTVITMDLEALRRALEDGPPHIRERLQKAMALLQQARATKRRIVADLRPILLDHLGLAPALNRHVEMWSTSSGVRVSLECSPSLPALPQDLALALFRIVQESLTNVARYANAAQVCITLEVLAEGLCLTIEDDGVGIAPEVLEKPRSHGIIGMTQRLAQFNGEFSIGRVAGSAGTRVSARIPLGAVQSTAEGAESVGRV
jgi:PAS domain S-box-containing protein